MPFKSVAQQHWMYSTHPKMAKEWASHTNFSSLPQKINQFPDEELKRKAKLHALKKML